MKKKFTTIAIGLAMLSAKANNFSAFNLKMFDNGQFIAVLDNQLSNNSNMFTVQQIQPGYHKLKVIRNYSIPYGFSMVQKVVYKGWINIPAKSIVYAQINCMNQFDIVKVDPVFCPPPAGGCGYNDWDDDDDYSYDNTSNCGNGNGWEYVPPAPAYMSPAAFMQLKASIESKSFESSKLQIAKQALAYNNFTSAQISDLMLLFDFETTKLDFAKCAYAKVIDKQNYYVVNNSFTFESSIQELNKYIAGV